jgi:hypothetical protein
MIVGLGDRRQRSLVTIEGNLSATRDRRVKLLAVALQPDRSVRLDAIE